jgi:hypothetical protein
MGDVPVCVTPHIAEYIQKKVGVCSCGLMLPKLTWLCREAGHRSIEECSQRTTIAHGRCLLGGRAA